MSEGLRCGKMRRLQVRTKFCQMPQQSAPLAASPGMMAGRRLLEKLGATVTEGAAIVDLPELGGSQRLKDSGLPLFTLVGFEGH